MSRPYKCPRRQSKISTDLSSLSLSVLTPSLSLPRSPSPPTLRAPPSLPHAVTAGTSLFFAWRHPAEAHGVAPPYSPRGGTRRRTLGWRGGLGHGLPAVAWGSVPSSSAGSRAGERPPPPAPATRGTLSPPPSGGTVAELGAVARWRGLPSSSSGGGTWWRGPLHLLSSGALLEAA